MSGKENPIESYGIDITEGISKMLSEELSKSINAEILKDLMNMGDMQHIKDKLDDMLKGIVRTNKVNDLLKDEKDI